MALINCPECAKEVSDKAEKCINCGYPLNKQEVKSTNYSNNEDKQQKVLIEKTSKDIKLQLLLGRVLLYVSLIIMFIGALTRPGVLIFGVILLIIAIAISITAKTSKWWDHD